MPAGSEGKAQGLMAMSHQLGFFVGPPIGGLIIDLVHWRGIFFFLFLPSVAGAAMCLWTGPAGGAAPASGQKNDSLGGVLLLAWTTPATLFRAEKIREGIGGANRSLMALVLVAAVVFFIRHERKHSSPLINLSVFSERIFGYGSVGLLICNVNQGLNTFINPFTCRKCFRYRRVSSARFFS